MTVVVPAPILVHEGKGIRDYGWGGGGVGDGMVGFRSLVSIYGNDDTGDQLWGGRSRLPGVTQGLYSFGDRIGSEYQG